MKTFRKIGLAIITVLTCICATSCGDDDDDSPIEQPSTENPSDKDPESNGNVLEIGGEQLNMKCAYWVPNTLNHKPAIRIRFYSFDPFKDKPSQSSENHMFVIDYIADNSNNKEILPATISNTDYHLDLIKGKWNGTSSDDTASNSSLVISEENDVFTVEIKHDIVTDLSGKNPQSISFSYTGEILLSPDR